MSDFSLNNYHIYIKICFVTSLISIVILLCTACNRREQETDNTEIITDEQFVVDHDSSYMFQGPNNEQYIVKADDGYYFRLNEILYYATETLDTVVPLCTQPNCPHGDASTEEARQNCSAYIGKSILFSNIQYYDNMIYVTANTDLITKEINTKNGFPLDNMYAISADGTVKKRIDWYECTQIAPLLHRGYIYYVFVEVVEEDRNGMKTPVSYSGIARRSVVTNEVEVLLDRSDVIMRLDGVQEMYAYQNYAYFFVVDKQNISHEYIYSIHDSKTTEIRNPGNSNNRLYSSIGFSGNKLIYRRISEDEVLNKVYMSDLDGSNDEYIMDLYNKRDRVGADEKYIYVDNGLSSEVIQGTGDRILRYYDRETFEYQGEINLGMKTSWFYMGYGDENYYFYFEVEDSKKRLMYFDKDGLETGNIDLYMLLEWDVE